MTFTEFIESGSASPSKPLRALWFAHRGDWEQAHNIAQAEASREASWVHAYLHRAEGDTTNANYWYRRAGRTSQTGDLQAEWESIARELLKSES